MLKTYRIGLLHNKANRIFRSELSGTLKEFDLSLPEWILLGTLCDQDNLRFLDIAKLLDIDPPFVTALVDKLVKKELVERAENDKDKRVKKILLTQKGRSLVPEIEERLKKRVEKLYKDIPTQDLSIYMKILNQFTTSHNRID